MERRSNSRRALAAVVVAVCGLIVAGCGREEPADLANGKALFVGEGQCGSCHILERAGTGGTQGPNLDTAFGPSRAAGMNAETVEGIVARQIAHPLRNSTMPANLVTGEDAEDVAAYVAHAAGIPGEDTGALAAVGGAEGTDGASIFTSLGCGSCHTFTPAGTQSEVGPNLDELADVAAERDPGTPADEYVKQSITQPNDVIVSGFEGIMPAFADRLSEEQLDALAEYLLQTGGG